MNTHLQEIHRFSPLSALCLSEWKPAPNRVSLACVDYLEVVARVDLTLSAAQSWKGSTVHCHPVTVLKSHYPDPSRSTQILLWGPQGSSDFCKCWLVLVPYSASSLRAPTWYHLLSLFMLHESSWIFMNLHNDEIIWNMMNDFDWFCRYIWAFHREETNLAELLAPLVRLVMPESPFVWSHGTMGLISSLQAYISNGIAVGIMTVFVRVEEEEMSPDELRRTLWFSMIFNTFHDALWKTTNIVDVFFRRMVPCCRVLSRVCFSWMFLAGSRKKARLTSVKSIHMVHFIQIIQQFQITS